ncbi:MAG: hypothetical protein ACLFWL_08295 [Candidatus Brocadiia bacterium]
MNSNDRNANGNARVWRAAVRQLFCPADATGTVEKYGNWWYRHSSYGVPANVTAYYRNVNVWDGTPPLWSFNRIGSPGQEVFLTATNNYYAAWSVHENILSSVKPQYGDAIGDVTWFHQNYTVNYLYFDGHVHRHKKPPHLLSYYAGRSYELVDGTVISTGGGGGEFLNLFHDGTEPVQ